jgi:hypothetical protein
MLTRIKLENVGAIFAGAHPLDEAAADVTQLG